MGETKAEAVGKRSRWLENLKIIVFTILYMLPLFWLWGKTHYPDSFGVHITAHGKAGLLENWWYSYRLLQRHQLWDIILFAYMWAVLVWVVGWIIWTLRQNRKAQAGVGAENRFD